MVERASCRCLGMECTAYRTVEMGAVYTGLLAMNDSLIGQTWSDDYKRAEVPVYITERGRISQSSG